MHIAQAPATRLVTANAGWRAAFPCPIYFLHTTHTAIRHTLQYSNRKKIQIPHALALESISISSTTLKTVYRPSFEIVSSWNEFHFHYYFRWLWWRQLVLQKPNDDDCILFPFTVPNRSVEIEGKCTTHKRAHIRDQHVSICAIWTMGVNVTGPKQICTKYDFVGCWPPVSTAVHVLCTNMPLP